MLSSERLCIAARAHRVPCGQGDKASCGQANLRKTLSHFDPSNLAVTVIVNSGRRKMSPKPITQNTLFYGDNLPIMREYIPTESIDLIYLDPPFNSNRSYNVLFKDEKGTDSEAQITAFDDTWHWGHSAEAIYHELVNGENQAVCSMIAANHKTVQFMVGTSL